MLVQLQKNLQSANLQLAIAACFAHQGALDSGNTQCSRPFPVIQSCKCSFAQGFCNSYWARLLAARYMYIGLIASADQPAVLVDKLQQNLLCERLCLIAKLKHGLKIAMVKYK